MKKLLSALLACLFLCSAAFAQDLPSAPEDWRFIGLTAAGVSFGIPGDCESLALNDDDVDAGIMAYLANADCLIQIRSFTPDELTCEEFLGILENTPSARLTTEDRDGLTVTFYRNLEPAEYSELYGIIFTGADGCFYKISFFTGDEGDFSETAKVWELAQTLSDSLIPMDFSEWPIHSEETAS